MTPDVVIEQYQGIVGAANAFAIRDDRAAPHVAALGARFSAAVAPSAVVQPNKTEQVQAIVKSAATLGVGIHVLPNATANGASFADLNNPSIVLDLSRLNAIHELDKVSGTVLLEPGVSFDQLQTRLLETQAGYWIDPDTNGAHSVSGSVAERALGYTPYGDHLLMQCGMEIVTATGEVVRTGMGALPGNNTWQLFKYNFGPYLDGLFSRSDFAIITKLGLWLMPKPPHFRPFMVELPTLKSVAQAVEIMRPLKIGMVVPNTVVIAHSSADSALLEASGYTTPAPMSNNWRLYGALYGLEQNVNITWQPIAASLAAIPGAVIVGPEPSDNGAWQLRRDLMQGVPAFSRATAAAQRGELWFAAGAPMEAEAVEAMLGILLSAESGSGNALAYELKLGWRTMFLQVTLDYENEEFTRSRAFVLDLIGKFHAAGFAITHDSPELSASVRESFVNPALRKLYTAIGQTLDAQGILGARSLP